MDKRDAQPVSPASENDMMLGMLETNSFFAV